jgi:hypothetical protein
MIKIKWHLHCPSQAYKRRQTCNSAFSQNTDPLKHINEDRPVVLNVLQFDWPHDDVPLQITLGMEGTQY